MTKNQYENIVAETLKSESADKGGLDTVRDILKNLGIGFPKGDVKEITKALETEDFMGWRTCSPEEAEEYISNGTPVIGINDCGVSVIINPGEIGGSGYNVLYSYNGETTCNENPEFQSGTYFINNKKTGKYLYSTSSAIDGRSGTFNSLGNNIRWKLILSEDNTYYIIYPINNAQKCLAVTGSGVALVNRTSNPTDYMKWEISSINNADESLFSIKNRGSSNYLKYENNSFGTSNNYVNEYIGWRIASVSQNVLNSELNTSFKFDDLRIDVGETMYAEVSEGYHNVLWALPNDFEYNLNPGGVSPFVEMETVSEGCRFTGVSRHSEIPVTVTHKVTGIVLSFNILINSNIDRFAYMLGQLYDLSLSYLSDGQVKAFERCCNYIRRFSYYDEDFNNCAGPIDTGFVDYVEDYPEVENYFKHLDATGNKAYRIFIDDTVSENDVDIEHMFYTINRLVYTGETTITISIPFPIDININAIPNLRRMVNDMMGWAGDLQSLIGDYFTKDFNLTNTTYEQIYSTFLSMLGSSDHKFPMEDLIADIDAVNLVHTLNNVSASNGTSLYFNIMNYYHFENNSSYCGNRFTTWRSLYSDEEFEELVFSYCRKDYIPGKEYPILKKFPKVVEINETEQAAFADAFIAFINNLVQNEGD